MRITGLTLAQFTACTEAVSVGRYNGNIVVNADAHDSYTSRKPACTARLSAVDSYGAGTRKAAMSGRHGPWVCWHAYRDVLKDVFETYPDAVIRTGIGTGGTIYRGLPGFLATYPGTAYANMGSQLQPVMMPDLCECDDSGGWPGGLRPAATTGDLVRRIDDELAGISDPVVFGPAF